MAQRSTTRIIGGRLLQALPVVLCATLIVFALVKMLPGDVAVVIAGDNASDERIAEIRTLYGLDRPLVTQYLAWLWDAVRGDLSRSLLSNEEVVTSIGRAFPNTLLIVFLAMVLSLAIGIPLGIGAATKPDSFIDRSVMMLASVGIAIPNFWLAMILVAVVSLHFGLLPATGAVPFSTDPLRAIQHAFLPALAIASGGIAEVARQLRSSLLDVLSSQYVRTLHAKGLSPGRILWQHGLKNVGVNLLTVTSLLVNRMLAATVVVEAVFAIPGMGSLIVRAAVQRDFPVVQGVVLAMVVVVILVNLISDLLCAIVDPRIDA